MTSVSGLTPQQMQALLDGPGLAPPPGIQPNFENPPNYRAAGIAISSITFSLATLSLLMRIYTRYFIIHQIKVEDVTIFIAWALFCVWTECGLQANRIAPGLHQWDVQLKHLQDFFYQIYVGSIMYGVCMLFIKLSILFQYLRIFVPNKRADALYWACHSLIWLNVIYYTIVTFLEIFACIPIAKAWNPFITGGHCNKITIIDIVSGSINALSDFLVLILPQIRIWRLQMSRKRKIQVSLVFLIGVLACVSSIVRLVYSQKLISSTDSTYYEWIVGIWSFIELASGIIVACVLVSTKFFQALIETKAVSHIISLLSTKSGGTSSSRSRGYSDTKTKSAFTAGQRGRTWPSSDYTNIPDPNHDFHTTTIHSGKGSADTAYKTHNGSGNGIFVMNDFDVRGTV